MTGAEGSGDVAIHAALLRSTASGAEILYFAGDAHDPAENMANPPRVDHTGVFKIIDSANNQFSVQKISSPKDVDGLLVDLFCSGHAQLEDGTLLVAGGTQFFNDETGGIHNEHFTGNRQSFIFDPRNNTWSEKPFLMNTEPGPDFEPGTKGGGRWYPTLLTPNNNEVLAFWGHPTVDPVHPDVPQLGDSRHTNNTPEYFSPARGANKGPGTSTWQILGRESDVPTGPDNLNYPRVHLLPNGRIFRATPVQDARTDNPESFNVEINPRPESLPDRNDISVRVSNAPEIPYNKTGDFTHPSVLLPLTPANRYQARVLWAGGPEPQYVTLGTALTGTGAALRYSWRATGPRDPANHDRDRLANRERFHAHGTILPTGEVFVSGGRSLPFDANNPASFIERSKVPEGEIYDWLKDSWRTVAPASVAREYHSVALLMPDGRVWHAGTSNTDINAGRGLRQQESQVELYEPWYYHMTRPVITSISGPPDPIYPGGILMHLHSSEMSVVVKHYRAISKIALVRAGSATHAFNSDQRYVELISSLAGTRPCADTNPCIESAVDVESPPSSNIAPPGNYLLFAIDDLGVPSVGRFIRIDRQFVEELRQVAGDFTSSEGGNIVNVRTGSLSTVANNTNSPVLEYGGIDFGPADGVVTQFSALLSSSTGGVFDVRLDLPNGPPIANLQFPSTGGRSIERVTPILVPVSGVHNVFIRFVRQSSSGSASVMVDWLKFLGGQTDIVTILGTPTLFVQPVDVFPRMGPRLNVSAKSNAPAAVLSLFYPGCFNNQYTRMTRTGSSYAFSATVPFDCASSIISGAMQIPPVMAVVQSTLGGSDSKTIRVNNPGPRFPGDGLP